MKKITYKLITADILNNLELLINDLIEKDWIPLGGPTNYNNLITQAITKTVKQSELMVKKSLPLKWYVKGSNDLLKLINEINNIVPYADYYLDKPDNYFYNKGYTTNGKEIIFRCNVIPSGYIEVTVDELRTHFIPFTE